MRIPKEIWLDRSLTMMEKLFLIEIDSLDNENWCFASNSYFSDFFWVTKWRCTQIIKQLESKNLINIVIERQWKMISKRIIRVVNKLNTPLVNKLNTGYLINDQDNNTLYSINITTLPPSEEVSEDFSEKKSSDTFNLFWQSFPHARKGKKQDALASYKRLDTNVVDKEINLLLRKIEIGQQDPQFIPACERWIRDFTQTNDLVKRSIGKSIVQYLRKLEWEKRKAAVVRFKHDFWDELAKELWNEVWKELNWIKIHLTDDNGKVKIYS